MLSILKAVFNIDGADSNPPLDDLHSLIPQHNLKFGKACFSPYVPKDVPKMWVDCGGTICSLKQATAEEHIRFFCYGRTDPWYAGLSRNAIAVFHAQWVIKVIEENFMLPIAPYVLNSDSYDASLIPPACTEQVVQAESSRNASMHKDAASMGIYSLFPYQNISKQGSSGSQSNDHNISYEEKTHSYSLFTSQGTPPRQITSTPRSPPLVSHRLSKRTLDSHFDLQPPKKKPRVSFMPSPREDSIIPSPQLDYPVSPSPVRVRPSRSRSRRLSRATISPNSSGETLVSIDSIPYIDFREVIKKRKSSDRLSVAPSRSDNDHGVGKPREIPSFSLAPADEYCDSSYITMANARTSLQHIQIDKAAVILPGRSHLGEKFSFAQSQFNFRMGRKNYSIPRN